MLFNVDGYPDFIDKMLNEAYATNDKFEGLNYDKEVWNYVREIKEVPHIGNVSFIIISEEIIRVIKYQLGVRDNFDLNNLFEISANDIVSNLYFNGEAYMDYELLVKKVEQHLIDVGEIDNCKWRLPTISELKSMYDIENNKGICGFAEKYYWSSTTYASSTGYAWLVYFLNGYANYYYKSNRSYVRCVRELEDGILELSQSSENKMTYYEAIEYTEDLEVADEDIIKIKLNGLLYEEIKDEN